MTTTTSTIGLIGVGLLGTALAKRLQSGGFSVLGYDRDPARGDALRELGGKVAPSAAKVVAKSQFVIFCLPDDEAVENVLGEAQRELAEGKFLINTSTGEPQAASLLAQRLGEDGVAYLDATIAGSSAQAARGETIMMIGGPAEQVAACDHILARLCKQYFHVGPSGGGSRMKLVVNLVLGLNRAALAEGLALAKASGLDMDMTLNVLKASPAYSASMTTKGRKMVEQDFSPQARLSQHLKDVGLILKLAREVGAATPLEATHEHLLRRALMQGYGDADNSAVIKAYNY